MKKIHIIVHAPFERAGAIHAWMRQHHYTYMETHTYKNDQLPVEKDFDLLVILGGPQSAVHIEKYPYLQEEADFIRETIEADLPVLGICLGAQLIGHALGAKAQRSPHCEIGVFPVDLTELGKQDPVFSQFKEHFPAMHWHFDMVGQFDGMQLLAKSKGCPRQAFRYGDRVYGIQFHLEMTRANVACLASHCNNDLTLEESFVQKEESLLLNDFEPINQQLFIILDELILKCPVVSAVKV